ncbi:MAG: hypothetical protein A2V85_17375 [Chloroflexi bacterium RBG_16_72_14]|nr:MAG: hypothetical protein A2V85_17375 [Chloroflexi bacterium RBG_16_72_14]
MDLNVVVGLLLLGVGTFAIAGGIAISIVEVLRPRPPAVASLDPITNLIKAITGLLDALAKFGPGLQLVILGVALYVVGIYVMAASPIG